MGTTTKGYTPTTGAIPTAAQWNAMVDPIYTEVNGLLDENNVAWADSDGIVTVQQTQSISGAKTFSNAAGVVVNYGLNLGGTSASASAWGLAGINLEAKAGTYTDSSTSGSATATNAAVNSFAVPTLAATNSSVTTTYASTVYIAGAPAAGTNQTLTNAYALWVDAGAVRLDGALTVTGATTYDSGDVTWNDNIKATFGTGGDADLYYDGTDVVFDPRVVGSGVLKVLNEAEVRGDAGAAGILTLSTGELTVVNGDILGRIDFQAPLESDGTDAILVGASIWAEADDTFAADLNDTDLVFAVAESETALERMRLSYDGATTNLHFAQVANISSAGDITLTAVGDVNIPASIGLTFGDDGEKIEGDGTDLTISSSNLLNLTATTDVAIPANVGLLFGTGEKIEGDNTDLTVTSGGAINLTATTDVVIPANVGVTFGSGEKIEGDSTDLTLTSGADISLTATGDVNIPSGVGVTFGDDGEKIEGDGTDLTIASSNALNLTATTDVVVPANVGITFGTGEKIEGDNTDLTVTSGGAINLTATTDVVVPANVGITFGSGEKIEGDSTDLTVTSGGDIALTATGDVNIPSGVGVTFGDDGEKIEGNGTDLTISGNNINLTAVADVVIPANVGVTFGTGEKIEGDNTDLTVTSGGLITLAAAGNTVVANALNVGGDINPVEFLAQGISNYGSANSASYADTQTVTMDMNGGLLFVVTDANTGHSGVFFANYNSDTIVELADPAGGFRINDDTDDGNINVFKEDNSQQISVVNNKGGSAHSLLIHTLGQVTTAAGPS